MTEQAGDKRRQASVLKREGTGWDAGGAVRFLLSTRPVTSPATSSLWTVAPRLSARAGGHRSKLGRGQQTRTARPVKARQRVRPSRACWAASDNDVAG